MHMCALPLKKGMYVHASKAGGKALNKPAVVLFSVQGDCVLVGLPGRGLAHPNTFDTLYCGLNFSFKK